MVVAVDSWAFFGICACIVAQSVKSGGLAYDTSHYNASDVLNNGAFVKESTEGLFYQEPVYLPKVFFFSSWRCGVLSPHT